MTNSTIRSAFAKNNADIIRSCLIWGAAVNVVLTNFVVEYYGGWYLLLIPDMFENDPKDREDPQLGKILTSVW
jgi:hypothetical protein